jgi:hypothetical protein
MLATESVDTYWVKIYISGPIEEAKQHLRGECKQKGLCVTIEPTTFIYTGGEEAGYVVGFVNYPKYPKPEREIFERAWTIAERLRKATFQDSYMIQDPKETLWVSDRAK